MRLHCVLLAVAAAVDLAAAAAGAARAAGDPARPNIVFFIADDMNADMFNFRPEGRGKNVSPNLDRLAAEGTILWGQHIASPVCTPSRYTCLTGRYASRARNQSMQRTAQLAGMTVVTWNANILPEDPTLAKHLQRAGYATGMVGKNHTITVPGWKRLPADADPRAPDVVRQLNENARLTHAAVRACGFDYAAAIYNNNAEYLGPEPLCVHNMDWVAKAGLDFIGQHKDRPFYLYFSTTLTHSPYPPEKSWNADPLATPDGYLEKPIDVLPPRASLRHRVEQAGLETGSRREMVLWLDDALGALLAKLEEHDLLDNTIIIFFNDNGQEGKGSIYQSATHAPSIVWRKEPFACGRASDIRVSNIDFAPTILDLVGAEIPSSVFDGRSFKSLLGGQTDPLHDTLYFELGFTRGVLQGDWKYIALRYPPNAASFGSVLNPPHMKGINVPPHNPPFGHIGGNNNEGKAMRTQRCYFDRHQLYNLAADPKEQTNLAADPAHAEKLAEMKAELQKYLKELPGDFAELDP